MLAWFVFVLHLTGAIVSARGLYEADRPLTAFYFAVVFAYCAVIVIIAFSYAMISPLPIDG